MSNIPPEISNFFLAMQAGSAAAPAMEALFADDAVYEEPFSGSPRLHEGRSAIVAAMQAGWLQPLPEMHLRIDRAETNGNTIAIDWTCWSPALPGGAGRGRNEFELREGRIVRLKTTLAM